jgi:hypothetical protein
VLSPYLFNWFINDLPKPRDCCLALYADDTSLISSVDRKNIPELVNILQNGLITLDNYFSHWKIKINNSKTECILFTHSTIAQRLKNTHKISINNVQLDWKSHGKFLGIFLDQRLTMKVNCMESIKKTKKAISLIYSLLKKHNKISVRNKLLLYKSYLRPILTYGCPAWANIAKSHLKKIQTVQNKCLRMALNAPYCTRISELHKNASIPTINEFINKLTDRFYLRSSTSENILINRLGNYNNSTLNFRVKHKLPKKKLIN